MAHFGVVFVLTISFLSMVLSQIHLDYSDRMNNGDLDHDCLLYNGAYPFPAYVDKGDIERPYQMIPFCIRSFDSTEQSSVIHGTQISFQTLQKQLISSAALYSLSVSIDLIEHYQAYLDNASDSLSDQVYYNCSIPWFGDHCQYTFGSNFSFDEIVRTHYEYLHLIIRDEVLTMNGTCLTFLKCVRSPLNSCLDWREICDGKIDCTDGGADEYRCEEIELNECSIEQFRCANGHCIPKDFFNDDSHNPDCPDHSDEVGDAQRWTSQSKCYRDPAFRCEEPTCFNERWLSCGDGQCVRGDCSSFRTARLRYERLSSLTNQHISYNCWTSVMCLTTKLTDRSPFFKDLQCARRDVDEKIIEEQCPEYFFFPSQPMVLDHVRFVFSNNVTKHMQFRMLLPAYICYDPQYCEYRLEPTVLVNGSSCRLFSEFEFERPLDHWAYLETKVLHFFLRCTDRISNRTECSRSKPFRCQNSSKCLAVNRLMDGFVDCFDGDDEHIYDSCSLADQKYRYRCLSEEKCIPMMNVRNNHQDCLDNEDEDVKVITILSNRRFHGEPPLSMLCDGFEEYLIDGQNYTDEMDCEQWPCDNIYTRCDALGIWNCPNGADETNCPRNLCRPDQHRCVSSSTYNFTCLPLTRVNDNRIDCLGGYDERMHCRRYGIGASYAFRYRCSDGETCIPADNLCKPWVSNCGTYEIHDQLCDESQHGLPQCHPTELYGSLHMSKLYFIRCNLAFDVNKPRKLNFTLKNHRIYPSNVIMNNKVIPSPMTKLHSNRISIRAERTEFCNRGIPIYSNDAKRHYCLCPPAYFGDSCEYQNQRISLTLQFRTEERRIVFNFLVVLMDNDSTIHSYEQIEYLSMRHCRKKFNLNLLYLTRPKSIHHTFYLRIDVYDKTQMSYQRSMHYPIRYSFLPVHRLALQIDVPTQELIRRSEDCPSTCSHGQCWRYANDNQYFCRCFAGYSGERCTIKHQCHCSSDSTCLGAIGNRSICLCPLNKFGLRCYLKNNVCRSNPCQHASQCIATDQSFFCICTEGFTGLLCEHRGTKVEFVFAKNIHIPPAVFVHFIQIPLLAIYDNTIPSVELIRTTMIAKIRFDHNYTFLYYENSFHLIFVQFDEHYYLALLQHHYQRVEYLVTMIRPEHRCRNVGELLDDPIRSYPRWHRVKYYPSLCRKWNDLVCFYDEDLFMCLCDLDRFANCFKFDFQRIYNCLGSNPCENGGQCSQDDDTCPTASSCFCAKCYYGSRCQFISTGFGLSLDAILSDNIWPQLSFTHQPIVVKITTSVTSIMLIIALVNSCLSIITFRTKQSLEVGCGLYLLISSVASLLAIVMFGLKFFTLLLSQMSTITNPSWLQVNCICIDFFLKTFLAIGDWLNACVAIERAVNVHLGVRFQRTQSKQVAKWIIIVVIFVTLATFLPDPIHRRVLVDKIEKRAWCVVRYSSSVQVIISSINIFHFVTPFAIHFISTVFLIICMARQKGKVRQKLTYRQHLIQQFHEHKSRLISSIALIIVALPRLLISLVSDCMKSARNPWLYLVAYLISFVPPLLIFVLYVLTSKFYLKEFNHGTLRIKKAFQRSFYSQSK